MRTLRIAAAAALLTAGGASAQAPNLEQAVKANYLYKFAPFVTWPAAAFANDHSAFQICIAGDDPFGPVLDGAVRGQRIGPRAIAVRRIARVDGVPGCHILFVGGSREQSMGDMLQAVQRQPVLTVSDERRGPAGSVIRFVVRNGRVRFVIDRRRAQASGIAISSALLDLAVVVED